MNGKSFKSRSGIMLTSKGVMEVLVMDVYHAGGNDPNSFTNAQARFVQTLLRAVDHIFDVAADTAVARQAHADHKELWHNCKNSLVENGTCANLCALSPTSYPIHICAALNLSICTV